MKVEVKTIATKEEKVVTLSESEFDHIVAEVAKQTIEDDKDKDVSDPMMDLLLLLTRARVCAIVREKLFGKEDR